MTQALSLFNLARVVETLQKEARTVAVYGQDIACAPLFETARSQAALFRLRPGQRIPAHTHSTIDDVFFCIRGRGTIRTWDARGAAHEQAVEPGTVVLVEPETPHEVSCAGDEFCYVLLQAPREQYDSHHYALADAPA